MSNNRLVYSTQSGAIHLCDFSYSANIALSPLSSSEIPHAATTPHHRLTSHPANPSSFALFTFEQSSSPHKKGKAKDASQNVHFSLFSIDEHNNIHIDCSHPFSGHGHPILDVSYAHTKRILTILDQAGHWLHYSIHPDTSAVQPLRHLQLLQRYNFATPSHSDLSVAAPSYLLATHDAFALLALPTYDALLLTLWDLKYGILLAETSLHSGRPTLVHCFQGLAVLLLASPTGDTRVYAQPYNLPDVSTLSLVIGRAPVTQSYLEQTTDASPTQQQQRRDKLASLIKNPLDKPASVALAELQQQHCNSCLADVRSHERPESLDVDALFGEWLGKCVRDLQQHHLKHPGKQSNTSKAKAKEALEAGQEISPPQLRTQLPLLDKAGHRFLLHGVTSGLDVRAAPLTRASRS